MLKCLSSAVKNNLGHNFLFRVSGLYNVTFSVDDRTKYYMKYLQNILLEFLLI